MRRFVPHLSTLAAIITKADMKRNNGADVTPTIEAPHGGRVQTSKLTDVQRRALTEYRQHLHERGMNFNDGAAILYAAMQHIMNELAKVSA